jgi:formylglycine-generating enzyme required for sulfatase activity
MKAFGTLAAALVVGAAGGVCVTQTQAQPVVIETVAVGNPGNPGEQSRLQNADATFYGGVAHTFWMGKFEVTAGQYTEFLNAVAATDPQGLYHPWMDYDAEPSRNGCNIKRQGTSGSYTYSVAPDWAERPVNYVSWADAVRFANWLHNGQRTGAPDLTTTEDGSYFINGISEFNDGLLEGVVRKPDATWVVPTDDEWYKAAYHKNDGVTGNYWDFPTGTNSFALLSNDVVDPDPGHHATYQNPGDYTVGTPYWRTEVGEHENSASPYGTFDQGGNVMEFTDTVGMISETRRMRGGSWNMAGGNLFVSEIDDVMHSSDQFRDLGFRLMALRGTDVTNVRGFDPESTYFDWDPVPGRSDAVYDVVRGELASLSGDADAVDLGLLICIENDSDDASSLAFPDTDTPASNTAFFYLVRFQDGPTIGPWGFGSQGRERSGIGGCPP